MPPQLQLSLLNVPPAMDAIAALPRPQHVILNHLYLQVGAALSMRLAGRGDTCCTGMAARRHRPSRSPRAPRLLQRMTASAHAMVVGTTHRYRSKYVTTIM